jgi:hypothetical protein
LPIGCAPAELDEATGVTDEILEHDPEAWKPVSGNHAQTKLDLV